jgi:hypothetical protein
MSIFIPALDRFAAHCPVFDAHSRPKSCCHLTFTPRSRRTMPHLTAQQKHDILLHCDSRRSDQTEQDVAALHGVTIGRTTLWEWRQRWKGTPQSLDREPVSGRPRILTPLEVSRHVRAPILAANRAHRAISYTKLLPEVHRKTGKKIALRTLQRTGKEQLGVKFKHRIKRTREECPYTHTYGEE